MNSLKHCLSFSPSLTFSMFWSSSLLWLEIDILLLCSLLSLPVAAAKIFPFASHFFTQPRLCTAFYLHSPLVPFPSLLPLTHAFFSTLFSFNFHTLVQEFSQFLHLPNYSRPSSSFLFKRQCSPLQRLFIELAAKIRLYTPWGNCIIDCTVSTVFA